MNILVVCKNAMCRFMLDAGSQHDGFRPELPLTHCPECGSGWSTRCPHCNALLEATLRDGLPPVCASCGQTMRPELEAEYVARHEDGQLLVKQQGAFD